MKNEKKGMKILISIIILTTLFFICLFSYENYKNPYNLDFNYVVNDKAYEAIEGDTVIIDYKGLKDGAEFEGGTDTEYALELGSNSFIDGFEEGLIGISKEEEIKLELTFPKDYTSEELAGQDVVFEVYVHDVLTPN